MTTIKKGGFITKSITFSHIQSIGFEFESTNLVKLTKPPKKSVLINTSLKNEDLEFGYKSDLGEYVNVDTADPNIVFKVTNDTASDSAINDLLNDLYKGDEDACEDKDNLFKIKIYNKQGDKFATHAVQFVQSANDEDICSTFSDTEWIVTYYKPVASKNVILDCFSDAIKRLHQHLKSLIPLKCEFVAMVKDEEVVVDDFSVKQIYHKPGTSLYYLNTVFKGDVERKLSREFRIDDVAIIPQMTFGCDIHYVFRVMHQLLIYSDEMLEKSKQYATLKNADIEERFILEQDFFTQVQDFVNKLFEAYNKNAKDAVQADSSTGFNRAFTKTDEESVKRFKIIKTYFTLIMYKLFVYFNSYLQNASSNEGHFFKLDLTMCVRHSNYLLYSEMKKNIHAYFQEELKGSESEKKSAVVQIVHNLVNFYVYDKPTVTKLYKTLFVRKYARSELIKMRKERPVVTQLEKTDEYYGDPLYSLTTYFDFFEDPVEQYANDWLEYSGVDYLSTKLDLVDNLVIVEYRDFPYQCFLNVYVNGTDNVRRFLDEETIYDDLNLSMLPVKAVMEYISSSHKLATASAKNVTRKRTVKEMMKYVSSSNKPATASAKNVTRKQSVKPNTLVAV